MGGDWSRAGLEPLVEIMNQAIKAGVYTPDPWIPVQIQPSAHIFEQVKLALFATN